MRAFADLFIELDQSTATLDKRRALVNYFANTSPKDAAWALYLLSGKKITGPKRKIAASGELRAWVAKANDLPDWLVEDSYHQVGDLAETLALLHIEPSSRIPPPSESLKQSPKHAHDNNEWNEHRSLSEWIEDYLLPVANQTESVRQEKIILAWNSLSFEPRLVLNKLLTGALRIGVSTRIVQLALAELSGVDIARIAQRMLGDWEPSETILANFLHPDALATDRSQPYPFYLASPLENNVESLGDINDWQLEWKWDGIRLQLIVRDDGIALWSRGEERLDGRFPEIEADALLLAQHAVIDGELLIWDYENNLPAPFTLLQTRIQRKKPSKDFLLKAPARLLVYDLLELDGVDLREQPQASRRLQLEELIANSFMDTQSTTIICPPLIQEKSWESAAELRQQSREYRAEGLMLKLKSSAYLAGRKRGDWWKWKIDPLTIDAVLIYAQAGHGRRSTLYTDYTFALWDGEQLVPVAKAYSGLTDKELSALDKWIRSNTLERFGPVRSVKPFHVFEIAFEGVNLSSRHKSGVAVRFPRILRWRTDKQPQDADQLTALKKLALG